MHWERGDEPGPQVGSQQEHVTRELHVNLSGGVDVP